MTTGNLHSTLERMERELNEGRDRLQSMTKDRETALEKLRSVEQELRSTNDELDRVNADLTNLFASTQIPTIFLDRSMVVRTFTPAASVIFSLIPSDRGRPIADIATSVDNPNFAQLVQSVLNGQPMREERVSRRDRTAHYMMRIVPYRVRDDAIDGAVVTFMDVTRAVTDENHHRLLIDELNHRVRNMLQVVSSLAAQTLKRSESLPAFSDAFQGRIGAIAMVYELLSDEKWGSITLKALVNKELKSHAAEENSFSVTGPEVMLTPKAALAFSLIFHELATNAFKYGSLSTPTGTVIVKWTSNVAEGPLVIE